MAGRGNGKSTRDFRRKVNDNNGRSHRLNERHKCHCNSRRYRRGERRRRREENKKYIPPVQKGGLQRKSEYKAARERRRTKDKKKEIKSNYPYSINRGLSSSTSSSRTVSNNVAPASSSVESTSSVESSSQVELSSSVESSVSDESTYQVEPSIAVATQEVTAVDTTSLVVEVDGDAFLINTLKAEVESLFGVEKEQRQKQGALSHPLAPLEDNVDSSAPLEGNTDSIDSSLDLVDELVLDDDADDDESALIGSDRFANRGQETLLAQSIGLPGIPRFDDPIFAKAQNISLPTNTMLYDECVRRNISISRRNVRSTFVNALMDPSTITAETHDDETVKNMKKQITAWYDEAEGANSTIVSEYTGKHEEDRDQVDLKHNGSLKEPIVYCYEGRVGNEIMCRFDTLTGARIEINARGVKGVMWRDGKSFKNLTFRKVPKTDGMEMNVIHSAVGDPWIESHKATPQHSSYNGVTKDVDNNPNGLYSAKVCVNKVTLHLGRREYAIPEDAALVYDLVAQHLPFKRRRRINFPSGQQAWRDARRQADVGDDEGLAFDEITAKATQYINDYRRSSSSSSTSNQTASSSSRSRRSSSSTNNQSASSSRSSRRSSSRETSVDDDDSVTSIETEVSTVVTRSNAPVRPSKPLKPELIKMREELETQVDDQYREIKFVTGLVQKLQKEVHALRQQVSLKSLMLARYDRSLTGPITASERERLAQLEADLEAKQQRYDLLHDKAIRTLAQKDEEIKCNENVFRQQIESLKNERVNLEKDRDELSQLLDDQLGHTRILLRQVESQSNTNTDLHQDITNLRSTLQDYESKIERFNSMESSLETVTTERDMLSARVESITQELTSTSSQLDTTKQDAAAARHSTEVRINELVKEKSDIIEAVELKTHEIDDLKQRLEVKDASHQQYVAENDGLKQQLKTQQASMEEAITARRAAQETITHKNHEIHTLTRNLEEANKSNCARLEEISRQERKLVEKESTLSKRENEIEDKEKAAVARVASNIDRKYKAALSQIQRERSTQQSLKDEVMAAKDKEISNLKRKSETNELATLHLYRAEMKIKNLERANVKLQSSLEKSNIAKQQAERDIQSSNEEKQQAKRDLQTLDTEVGILKDQLAQAENSIETLQLQKKDNIKKSMLDNQKAKRKRRQLHEESLASHTCSKCNRTLQKTDFSKKQLNKRSQAKCIDCVEADSSSHDNKRRKLMD